MKSYDTIKNMEYYLCTNNAMLSLQFCEPVGMNMLVSPKTLNVVWFGYMVHLLQGFSQFREMIKTSKQKQSDEEKGAHYVFSDDFPEWNK